MIEFIMKSYIKPRTCDISRINNLWKSLKLLRNQETWNGFAENLNLFNYWLSLKKKVPAVISSLKWKEYYKNKENKK